MIRQNPSAGDLLSLPGYACAYVGDAEVHPGFTPTPDAELPDQVQRGQVVRITAQHSGRAVVAVVSADTWNDRRRGTVDSVYAELLRRLDLDPGMPGVVGWQLVVEDLPAAAPELPACAVVPAPATSPELEPQPAAASAEDDAAVVRSAAAHRGDDRAFWLTGRYGEASARALVTAADLDLDGGRLAAITGEIVRFLGLDADGHPTVEWDITSED